MGATPSDDERTVRTNKRSLLKLMGTSALALGGAGSVSVGRASASTGSCGETVEDPPLYFAEVNPEEEYFVLWNQSGSDDVPLGGAVVYMEYCGAAGQRQTIESTDEPTDGPYALFGSTLKVATGAKEVPDADLTLGFEEPVMSDDGSDTYAVLWPDGTVLARSDAAEENFEHELEILGVSDDPTRYRFSTADFGGEFAPDPSTIEKWDSVGGQYISADAEGWVPAGWGDGEDDLDRFERLDRYYFDGEFDTFEVSQEAVSVSVDGARTDPAALNAGYRHSILISGEGEPANYAFEVGGRLEPAADTIEKWDTVSETGAEGWVTDPSHEDKYYYDGELTSFEFREGEASVELNKWPVPTERLPYEHEIKIVGQGEPTNYAFEVSESLQPVSDTIERWDSVSERSAEGWVTEYSHTDVYRFNGAITAFEFKEGEASVSLALGPEYHPIAEPDSRW